MVEPVTDVEALIDWHDRRVKRHTTMLDAVVRNDLGDASNNPRAIFQQEELTFHANAASALRTLQERCKELEAKIAGINPNVADLWWVHDDPEAGYDDADEAFEYGNGYGPEPGIVQLQRARRLPNVWATRIVLTRDEDGEPDDTEVRCFHTKAEAEAAITGANQ